MSTRASYGQFCPVAKACEVFTERWTPLIIREMISGSCRFGEIHKGVPLMSRSLLSKRLQELEAAGIVVRTPSGSGYDVYKLTPAGAELGPIVVQLAVWGKQWTKSDYSQRELDAGLLMWDMRRRINHLQLPEQQVVVHFLYHDAPQSRKRWWLLMDRNDADLCLIDPGVDPDVTVSTTVRTMTSIWMGDLTFGQALQDRDLVIEGPSALRTKLPSWLMLNAMAEVDRRA